MEYVLRDNSTDLSKCQRRFFTKVWRKCMIGIFHFLRILFLRCQPMHFPCIFCRIVCLRIYQLTLYNFGCYKKILDQFKNYYFLILYSFLLLQICCGTTRKNTIFITNYMIVIYIPKIRKVQQVHTTSTFSCECVISFDQCLLQWWNWCSRATHDVVL